jgi:Arc/MetJ-type ribon-helix-helix transcriptional regulator
MTTLKIILDAEEDLFVEKQVRLGVYADAETAIRAAVGRLGEDEVAREKRFRAMLQEGLDDLAAGRFEEVGDAAAWLDGVINRNDRRVGAATISNSPASQ